MTRARACVAVALAALSVSGPRPADAHDFHASFTVIERSAREPIFEISMRVFADDLEGVLAGRAGRAVRIGVAADIDALIHEYVVASLELRNAAGDVKPLAWVGKEARVDSVWIYLETPAEALQGFQVRNRVLHESFADQVNLVQVKDGARQSMLNFRRGDDFKAVDN